MRGVARNVTLLGLVSLLSDLSSQMVFPLVPLYLTSVLGAPVVAVGLIEGAAESVAALLKVVSGFWSDRVGRRKPFILIGYSLSGFVKPLLAFAGGWPQVLAIRAFERVGKGLRNAPRDALIADSSTAEDRGRAFGVQRAMDGIGSLLGALLAALLLTLQTGAKEEVFRSAFLASIIPALLATAAILAVREPDRARPRTETPPTATQSWRELPTDLKRFLFAAALFSFGHVGYAFLLLRSKSAGFDDGESMLLYAAFYLVFSVTSAPLGRLSDRVGRKRFVQAGYALFASLAASLAVFDAPATIVPAFLGYGVFYAIANTGQRAFVVDLCPPPLRATALGAFNTAVGLVALPGGVVAGLLWDAVSPEATFAVAAGMALIALALVSRIHAR